MASNINTNQDLEAEVMEVFFQDLLEDETMFINEMSETSPFDVDDSEALVEDFMLITGYDKGEAEIAARNVLIYDDGRYF